MPLSIFKTLTSARTIVLSKDFYISIQNRKSWVYLFWIRWSLTPPPFPGNIDFEWFNIERFRMERKSSQFKDRSLPQERPILWPVGYSKGRRSLIKTGVIYLEWTGSVDVLIDVNNDIMGRKNWTCSSCVEVYLLELNYE